MKAVASGNPVLGTWKLKSYVVTAGTGEKSTPYGENPIGYLSYSADGRMHAIGTSRGRIVPLTPTPRDEERVALHETMFAYAGTYSLEAAKVTHHVDISWNEVWNGTLLELNAVRDDPHIPCDRPDKREGSPVRCRVGEGNKSAIARIVRRHTTGAIGNSAPRFRVPYRIP